MNEKFWTAFKTAMWGIGTAAATGGLDAVYQCLISGGISKEELTKAAILGAITGAVSYYKNPPKEKRK